MTVEDPVTKALEATQQEQLTGKTRDTKEDYLGRNSVSLA